MWPFSSSCHSKLRLTGKTVVITGGNAGVGKETARDLYWRGARVVLACRNLKKAEDAVEDIKKTPPSKSEQYQGSPGELVVCKLDLTKFSSVRECAKLLNSTEKEIHILINNAGVMTTPQEKTEDGYELQLQSNHLGHFLLTLLLLPKIKDSAPSRIINVSSMAHTQVQIDLDDINLDKSYDPFKAYRQSKLANIMFAKELASRLQESKVDGINTYSLHPGVIPTDLVNNFDTAFFPGATFLFKSARFFMKTPVLGAQTTIHCAVDEEAGKETGLYYAECKPANSSNQSHDKEVAAKFWTLSLKAVGLPDKENLKDLMEAISNEILPSL